MDLDIVTSPIADGHARLIAATGRLDVDSCQELDRAAAEAVSARRPVILDLSDCAFADSSGARTILELFNGTRDGDSPLPMGIVVGDSALTTFALTAIHPSIPLFETLGKALEWLDTELRSNGGHPGSGFP